LLQTNLNNTKKQMSRSLIWGSSLLLAFFMMVAAPVHKANAQPGVSVSFQTFYDALSPHGQWIDDPENGYVWSPRGVGSDFRPYYSGGNWAMTDYGNTWVSDYPWGWAPFHYGRWAYSPFYGWLWVPGTTWGPAWVHWRGGGGNYGWAPMGPGVNININIGGGGYYPQSNWWTFVPCNRIYHRGGYGRYWRGANYNNTYINNTTIINNTYVYNNNTYITGPRRREVERTTGQRVNVYNVRNDNTPGRSRIDGRNLNVYRPEVRQDRSADMRPQNVVRAERGNRDMNNTVRSTGDLNTERNIRSNGQQQGINNMRDRQAETSRMRQQPAAQVQHERADRDRDSRMTQQQQRDVQMQQERTSRERESRMVQQRRDMQVQQERSGREMQALQQQRDAQVQQRRVQQQRAAEQRAQQQQQIESRRQQRFEQPQQQQRVYDRGGSSNQRVQRSQPQQPTQNMSRGSGENTGRRR
jgi:hypothetical protein